MIEREGRKPVILAEGWMNAEERLTVEITLYDNVLMSQVPLLQMEQCLWHYSGWRWI